MKKVLILALPGTMASTVTGPMDIFSLAGVLWRTIRGDAPAPAFSVKMVGIDASRVVCVNGMVLVPDVGLKDSGQADLVVVSAAEVPTIALHAGVLNPWLLAQYKGGATVASVCTGAFALAQAGLLAGKKATTHWGFADAFRKAYPDVTLTPERLIVDSGQTVTGGGVHSYFDICLFLIERFAGHELAAETARALLLDMGRRSQMPYSSRHFLQNHGDADIARVQTYLEDHCTEQLSVRELARQNFFSERNLARRFKQATGSTLQAYLQDIRVERAKELLSTTSETVERIAGIVGYDDIPTFRRLFKRLTNVTPREYRRLFGLYTNRAGPT